MIMVFSHSPSFGSGRGASALRSLAWDDLCARLVAAHELQATRRQLAGSEPVASASQSGCFSRSAATMLLDLHTLCAGHPVPSADGMTGDGYVCADHRDAPFRNRTPCRICDNRND
jgi:hypothetical protein